MSQKRIYLCLAHMSGNEQKFIQEAFDTNWVVPLGPNVNGFEADLETFVGEGKKVVALSAGTAAIHLALLACGVGQGDEGYHLFALANKSFQIGFKAINIRT